MSNTVKIDFIKLSELHEAVKTPSWIKTSWAKAEWLATHYKCSEVQIDWDLVALGKKSITLKFDNEQDYIWFKLKHL